MNIEKKRIHKDEMPALNLNDDDNDVDNDYRCIDGWMTCSSRTQHESPNQRCYRSFRYDFSSPLFLPDTPWHWLLVLFQRLPLPLIHHTLPFRSHSLQFITRAYILHSMNEEEKKIN